MTATDRILTKTKDGNSPPDGRGAIPSAPVRRGKNLSELVKYCLIGCVGASLDALLFYWLTKNTEIHYQFVNVFSVTCGIVNNFILNAFLNFKVTNHFFRRFASFYLIGMFGWALSALLLWLFVERMKLTPITAKLMIIFIVTVVQFTLNKLITFSRKPSQTKIAESK